MTTTWAGTDQRFRIADEALEELPIFPLPNTVLLPRTLMSLHVFEPRYRALMEDCIDGHRLMAIGMLDDDRGPDEYERPPIHRVAGIGRLRKSTRKADGGFNILLEGIGRADISSEWGPTKPYRRARARMLADEIPRDKSDLALAMFNLRTLSARALAHITEQEAEILRSLNGVQDPACLADIIAAATIEDSGDRQHVLSTASVLERVRLVAGLLGQMLLIAQDDIEGPEPVVDLRWGVTLGRA